MFCLRRPTMRLRLLGLKTGHKRSEKASEGFHFRQEFAESKLAHLLFSTLFF